MFMKGFLTTDIGIEPDGIKEFDVDNVEELAKIAYFSQLAKRVALTISITKDFDIEKNLIGDFSFKEWIKPETSFRVVCDNISDKNLSQDIEMEIGAQVIASIEKELGFKAKVSLNEPDIIVYCYVNKSAWLGIDFSGKDMSKRQYKIYSVPTAYRGTIGYGLLKFAGYVPGKKLLDPFAGCGIITIEAGLLMSGFSVNHFEKLAYQKFLDVKFDDKPEEISGIWNVDVTNKNVKFAKNNEKIAGIKGIEYSKCDGDYLDTKFDEGEFDFIVTQIQQASKHFSEKQAEKINDEFFYQANYVLAKDGIIAILAQRKDALVSAAEKHNFKLIDEKVIEGGVIYYMLKFTKA